MPMSERRRSRRKIPRMINLAMQPLDPQIWFRFWTGSECEVHDISLVGLGVTCGQKIPVGTPLSIDMRMGSTGNVIRIFGRVQWLVKNGEQYRAGVKFSWWKDDADKKTVDSYLDRLSSAN